MEEVSMIRWEKTSSKHRSCFEKKTLRNPISKWTLWPARVILLDGGKNLLINRIISSSARVGDNASIRCSSRLMWLIDSASLVADKIPSLINTSFEARIFRDSQTTSPTESRECLAGSRPPVSTSINSKRSGIREKNYCNVIDMEPSSYRLPLTNLYNWSSSSIS